MKRAISPDPDQGRPSAAFARLDQARAPAVFVVDDDPAVLNSLEFALGVHGYEVSTYSSGAALLEAAGDLGSGCVVVDHRPRGINGIDLAKALRSRGVEMPVILITHAGAELLDRAAIKGVSVIEKPLNAAALESAMRTAVS
jgi:FixJ family two-component response regulator